MRTLNRTRPFALMALAAAAVLMLAVPAAGRPDRAPSDASPTTRPVTLGIADQKPDMFTDARFGSLGVRHARLVVAWNALRVRWQRAELDRWLRAARGAGVEPLVTFKSARSKRRSVRRRLPTLRQFRVEVRRFRKRYPWVRTFATWNEANLCGEPTCHRPRLVARYWRVLRRQCVGCTVLAATVLDVPGMVEWVRAFRRAARMEPRWWGLNNYVDANRFRTTGTRGLLRTVRGKVWLTETGGIVARRQPRGRRRIERVPLPESPRHAARALKWVLYRLVPLSRRIERVYLYHWNAGSPRATWDSGLVTRKGRPRPAFRELKRYLARVRPPVPSPPPPVAPAPPVVTPVPSAPQPPAAPAPAPVPTPSQPSTR